MAEKEEIILEVKLEQSDALTEMERLKKSIVQTKQEQAELNKAFKAGNITLDEYAQDSVRLEGILKKNQAAYNNVQKSVTGVKTQLDKLIESNKKISEDLKKTSQSFQDVAGSITVAGVNVGSLTTKLATFNNPATAAVTVVSALTAAYARSTLGAKDLSFAQSQLSEAVTLTTNQIASLITSAEDGEGAITKLFNSALTFADKFPGFFVPRTILGFLGVDLEEIRKKSKELALIAEELEDKQRAEVDLRTAANDRLSYNQELLTQIQDEQTTYNQKIDKTQEIITNITRNQEEISGNLNEQLALTQKQVDSDEAREVLLDAQNAIKKQISALEKDSERKIQAIVRLQQNITEQNEKQLKTEQDKARLRDAALAAAKALGSDNLLSGINLSAQSGVTNKPKEESLLSEGSLGVIDSQKALNSATKKLGDEIVDVQKSQYAQDLQNFLETEDAKQKARSAGLDAAVAVSAALSGLAEEGTELQKALALVSIGIDTAEAIAGLTAASEENPANGVTFGAAGIAQFASGLIRIIANIASAKSYLGDRAAGGGDFMTKGPTMLMVGDNPGGVERVTVEPLSGKGKTYVSPNSNLIAMAGGGSLTTYPGLIANSVNQDTNNNLAQVNMMKRVVKNMPAPIVGVKQITLEQNRVKVKQNIATAG